MYMKRCLTLLIIREMQIKTIMQYDLTQVRMPIINNSTNKRSWRGCEEMEMWKMKAPYTLVIT